jgi:hypothetical protein
MLEFFFSQICEYCMRVYFSGESIPKSDLDEISDAAKFFGKILLGYKLAANIDLEIKIDPNFEWLGGCYPDDDSRFPRFFVITLNPSSIEDDMIQTLAHEMVHLRQFARRQAVISGDIAIWNGERYKIFEHDETTESYRSMPWEEEAFSKELELYKKWLNYDS